MTGRAILAAIVLALAGATAVGADFEPGSFRREIETAVKDGAPDRAVAAIDRLLDDAAPRIRARHVEAAKAALDLLPWETAAPRASRLLAEALSLDPSNRDGAWTAAQSLRVELTRKVDVETGERFLAKLAEIYPDYIDYRSERADLLFNGSRREEGRAELEVLFRMAPSNTRAGYQLAVMAEEDGDIPGAISTWDRLIVARPFDLWPRFMKARVLSTKDRPAARAALEEGRRAAAASDNESVRASYLERFDDLRTWIDDEDARHEIIRQTEERQRLAMAAAIAVWAVVAGCGLLATRAAPAAAPARK